MELGMYCLRRLLVLCDEEGSFLGLSLGPGLGQVGLVEVGRQGLGKYAFLGGRGVKGKERLWDDGGRVVFCVLWWW